MLLDIFIVGVVLLFNREFLAISFDEEYAEVSGLKSTALYLLLLSLIALTVVVMVRVVGIVMVIALLSVPAAIARNFSRSIPSMMAMATVFSFLFSIAGLVLSYMFDLASGATIILVAASAFFLVQGWRFLSGGR
jgi:zinc transport system permease protein